MVTSFFYFLYFAILVFLPILLNDYYHILYLLLTVSMILGSIIFKRMQQKIDLKKLMMIISILKPLLIITFGLVYTKSIISLSCLLFLYGITTGFVPPLFSTVISNIYEEVKGTALGFFNFIRYSGTALGGMFTGIMHVFSSMFIFIFLGVFLSGISFFQLL